MEEYLDILDEQGNETGKTELRSVVHKTGLWHRTVHIYIYRKVGEVVELLVHLRSAFVDLHPNEWDTRFGGHLKVGQTLDQALESEMLEETGLAVSISDVKVGPTIKSKRFPNNEFTTVYFYEFTGDLSELKFNDGEVVDAKWMSTGDVLEDMQNNPNSWAGRAENFKEIQKILLSL